MKETKINRTERKPRRNSQWGNLNVIRTKRGILLVDSKNPDNKRFFLNEEFKKSSKKKQTQKQGV